MKDSSSSFLTLSLTFLPFSMTSPWTQANISSLTHTHSNTQKPQLSFHHQKELVQIGFCLNISWNRQMDTKVLKCTAFSRKFQHITVKLVKSDIWLSLVIFVFSVTLILGLMLYWCKRGELIMHQNDVKSFTDGVKKATGRGDSGKKNGKIKEGKRILTDTALSSFHILYHTDSREQYEWSHSGKGRRHPPSKNKYKQL